VDDIDARARKDEVAKAQEARRLLDNPLLKAAFESEEKAVLDALALTHDTEQVLKLHRAFCWGRIMRARLQEYIETGKLAAFQLDDERKFKLWRSN
jgi:hypothetical protein